MSCFVHSLLRYVKIVWTLRADLITDTVVVPVGVHRITLRGVFSWNAPCKGLIFFAWGARGRVQIPASRPNSSNGYLQETSISRPLGLPSESVPNYSKHLALARIQHVSLGGDF